VSGRTPVLQPDPDRGETGVGESRRLVVRQEILDILIGSAIVGVAAWFWIAAADIADEGEPGIGPTAFPKGLALFLGAAALVLIVRAVGRIVSGRLDPESTTGRPLSVLGGIALAVAFPAVMARFGYYPAMGLLIPALLWAAGYRKPLGFVLYTAGFLAFTKLVFGVILQVPLP
jgi:hypothetical protein